MEKITLTKDTIDQEDLIALSEWIATNPRLSKGPLTEKYEKKYAASCGRDYAVFVNSGSSANLIAIYALIADGRLKNKKIVVPSLSWITTISPIIQFGLAPILVDCNMQNLSVCPIELEKIFEQQRPACLFMVSVLGMVPDMEDIVRLCRKYDVALLCDNCESQSSFYEHKSIESFGLMSTCSSFVGHITSTIEGGMVTTDDWELYNVLKMLRSHGWDRDLGEEERVKLRTEHNVNDFNGMYTFYQPGFNLRSTDLQAFIGLRQLAKLNGFVKARNDNFKLFNQKIKNDYWRPAEYPDRIVSNMGYPVIHPKRDEIVKALQENNVEVRPLISGSMGSQPFWVERYNAQVLPNSSIVDSYGFYVPNHPYIKEEEICCVADIINKIIG